MKEKSNVDGLELSLSTDYTRDRITLIRMNITSVDGKGTTRTTIAPDSMLGIYFGNGLFLDNNENLVIIPNRLLNIGENFVGKSVYSGYTFTAAGGQPIERVSTFSNGKIEIKAKGIILGDQQIEYNSKSASGNGETIYFNEKNTKIRPTVFVPVISFEYVWEKKQTSLRKTWGLLKSNEYTLVNQRIIDKEKRILVENNGTYLRFAYTKGNKYAFRVYRSKACVLIINENTALIKCETTFIEAPNTNLRVRLFAIFILILLIKYGINLWIQVNCLVIQRIRVKNLNVRIVLEFLMISYFSYPSKFSAVFPWLCQSFLHQD